MRTQVEFVSDAFPPYPGENEEINPGIWGKRLAEFISSELSGLGIATDEFYSEDWGWEIPVRNSAFPIYLGCSNQTDPGSNCFLCFIEPSRPQIRKGLFKKIDTVTDVTRVADALDAILSNHPTIRDLKWIQDSEN